MFIRWFKSKWRPWIHENNIKTSKRIFHVRVTDLKTKHRDSIFDEIFVNLVEPINTYYMGDNTIKWLRRGFTASRGGGVVGRQRVQWPLSWIAPEVLHFNKFRFFLSVLIFYDKQIGHCLYFFSSERLFWKWQKFARPKRVSLIKCINWLLHITEGPFVRVTMKLD